MSKKLLIASTFGQDAVKDWRTIQRRFIDKYTQEYDYAVFLHDITRNKFRDCEIIGRTSGELMHRLPEMFHQIYKYFKKKKYDNYLLLDSDCFPIKSNWHQNLLRIMDDKWYAAPVRTDNMDVCPHPCALFIRGEYINERIFYFQRDLKPTYNLLGEIVIDIGTGFKTEHGGENIFFPLIRSNFINLHPVIGAIYGDTFYHHGAGSRLPFFRSTDYWQKVSPLHYKAGKRCYNWFRKNPDKYIDRMRGVGVVDGAQAMKKFFKENDLCH